MNPYPYSQNKVKDVMSQNLVTVTENTLLSEVDAIFNSNSFHHIPVVDKNQQLVGIISKADLNLIKDWATAKELRTSQVRNRNLLNSQLAEDIMQKNLVTVNPQDQLERCADLLKENYFHALPVIDDKRLVGIVTTLDLIRVAYTSPQTIK